MSPTVNFFMGFYVDNSDSKIESDIIIISNFVRQYAIYLKS